MLEQLRIAGDEVIGLHVHGGRNDQVVLVVAVNTAVLRMMATKTRAAMAPSRP